ncbi:hypothetical protein [Thiorhodovibrio frisius]|uniref:Uncharacterized protein n=1 Tax=Thiorhodovibrio frisius TaxID=631362 RepID=H8YYA6_9GAMM|nr:hypothetical protein [Thiorhodovibrio frisius]EIC23432.1 hypothetical protein Thi970DRAFT_01097 [Thiorhodovibrio frisius]WPL23487.1 hypothetical protein Thiofri_03675 [Thiorhodovibrio frisius]
MDVGRIQEETFAVRMLGAEVKRGILQTLYTERLFRDDCKAPSQSVTSRLEHAFAKSVGSRYFVAVNSLVDQVRFQSEFA